MADLLLPKLLPLPYSCSNWGALKFFLESWLHDSWACRISTSNFLWSSRSRPPKLHLQNYAATNLLPPTRLSPPCPWSNWSMLRFFEKANYTIYQFIKSQLQILRVLPDLAFQIASSKLRNKNISTTATTSFFIQLRCV